MGLSAFDEVRKMASDIFGVPAAKLTADSSPDTVESWDSVQHLNLILALESEFKLHFEPEEIDRMKTIGDVSALVAAKLARGN